MRQAGHLACAHFSAWMYRESSTGMFQLEAGSVRTPPPASDELYRAHSRRGVASEQALLAVTRCKEGCFQRCETRIDPFLSVVSSLDLRIVSTIVAFQHSWDLARSDGCGVFAEEVLLTAMPTISLHGRMYGVFRSNSHHGHREPKKY